MGWLAGLWRKMFNSCARSDSGSEEAAAQSDVELGSARAKWTLAHSYYANMGGLRIGTKNSDCVFDLGTRKFKTIAVTTRQFSYLRKKGIIEATPSISEEEIKDKGKADYFTKGLAVVQILWLILSVRGRAARNFSISQLEVITIAFAFCALATYSFAWNKPQSMCIATTILATKKLEGEVA
jgi:hypothetical protein